MAATVSQSSNYVEGGYRTRRFSITGDTAYATGGYDLLAAIRGLPGFGPLVINRVISVRPTSLAANAWQPVITNTFGGGSINGLRLILANGATEVASGTNVTTGTYELVVEGQ